MSGKRVVPALKSHPEIRLPRFRFLLCLKGSKPTSPTSFCSSFIFVLWGHSWVALIPTLRAEAVPTQGHHKSILTFPLSHSFSEYQKLSCEPTPCCRLTMCNEGYMEGSKKMELLVSSLRSHKIKHFLVSIHAKSFDCCHIYAYMDVALITVFLIFQVEPYNLRLINASMRKKQHLGLCCSDHKVNAFLIHISLDWTPDEN